MKFEKSNVYFLFSIFYFALVHAFSFQLSDSLSVGSMSSQQHFDDGMLPQKHVSSHVVRACCASLERHLLM